MIPPSADQTAEVDVAEGKARQEGKVRPQKEALRFIALASHVI